MTRTPPSRPPGTVLVTGSSSGIGRATALELARRGHLVLAGVRTDDDAAALRTAAAGVPGRVEPLLLDVTDPGSIERAAAAVAGHGRLDGLVNNAGLSVAAPLECLPSADLRLQLEVNLVGRHALVRELLPHLRAARGRVVQVVSGMGRVAPAFLGAYCMTQFANEALGDVLRRELAPQGVGVVVVEPGAIMTPIWAKTAARGTAILDAAPPAAAAAHRRAFPAFLAANEERARRSRVTPQHCAEVVARALEARRPRPRYTVGPDARLAALAARLLPDALLDRVLRPPVAPDGPGAPDGPDAPDAPGRPAVHALPGVPAAGNR